MRNPGWVEFVGWVRFEAPPGRVRARGGPEAVARNLEAMLLHYPEDDVCKEMESTESMAMAVDSPAGLPHAFVVEGPGVPDRACKLCGLPETNLIHMPVKFDREHGFVEMLMVIDYRLSWLCERWKLTDELGRIASGLKGPEKRAGGVVNPPVPVPGVPLKSPRPGSGGPLHFFRLGPLYVVFGPFFGLGWGQTFARFILNYPE